MKLWVVLGIVTSSISDDIRQRNDCSEVIYAQFQSCSTIMSLDCTTFTGIAECATNGVTYMNRCEFGKAHCNNTSIHIVASGHCHSVPSMTIVPLLPGTDAIQDFFCTQLSHINCPVTADEMCGTDGKTYKNGCEYEKQRCTHRNLHLDYVGPCRG